MTDKRKTFQRVLSFLLSAVLLLSLFPWNAPELHVAAENGLTRYADPSTMEDWHQFYYHSKNEFDTSNAGGIWTDKTVLTSADELEALGVSGISDPSERGFLGVLSVMSSNMKVTGVAAIPTDTMLILDLSSSMYSGATRDPKSVNLMIESVNQSISELYSLNEHNRAGVVIYFGGDSIYTQSSSSNSMVLLPLGRYEKGAKGYIESTVKSGKLQSIQACSDIKGINPASYKYTLPGTSIAGTYAQLGLHEALEQFLAADTTVPADAATQAGADRMPVFIFMSDGEPTAGTEYYTDSSKNSTMGNNQVLTRSPAEIDFVTQLTASWVKEMTDAHYEKYVPQFYSLSLGTAISLDVMDPKNQVPTAGSTTETIHKYWSDLLDADKTAKFYTLNYGSGDANRNPTNKVSHTVSTVNITKDGTVVAAFPTSTKQRNYVDTAFTASDASELESIFSQIIQDISIHSQYHPTLVNGSDTTHSGYISFVDKIGRYMNVTDINGLIIGNHLYTGSHMAHAFDSGALGTVQSPTDLGDNLIWSIKQRLGVDASTARGLISSAYGAGQLYYNSDTDFSNYFGWYSDADNKFLGFYAEGTTVPAGAVYTNKSYLFLGQYDSTSKTYDSQPMYATVRVRETIATGEDEVNFAVPAYLVPVINYNVELDINGSPESITTNAAQVSPIRLVYETELDSRINQWTANEIVDEPYRTYVSPEGNHYTTNADGSLNFFNNKWDFDGEEGYGTYNTYSYFRPSYENNRFYFQQDVTIMVASGSGYIPYEGDKPAAGDGNTYYYGTTVYCKTGENSYEAKTAYEQLRDEVLPAADESSDGSWYIPAKYIRRDYADTHFVKSSNNTGTLPDIVAPYFDYSEGKANANQEGHEAIVGATLGNNGKIVLDAQTGIKITKQVEETIDPGDKLFSFTVTNTAVKGLTCDALKVDAEGNETDTSVTFNSEGVATVSLKAGESLYIGGMSKGHRVTVKELGDVDYIVTALAIGGIAAEDTVAEVILGNADMPHAVFTNGVREKGSVTVSKRITHPYGTDYTIPADKEFTVTLTLTLNGAALANYALEGGFVTDVNGQITFKLTHNSSQLISGIPIGTVAVVTEAAPTGFTPSYIEDIDTVNDGSVTVSQVPVTVAIVNDYVPNPPSVPGNKITVSGIKRFDQEGHARPWQVGDSFTFLLQEYKDDWVTMEHENAVQTITITEGDGYAGTTRDYPFSFADVFEAVTYSAPGTYYYRVVEQAGSIPGVNYDVTTHRFEVTVSDDDMDGTLDITNVETQETTVTVTGSYDVTATLVNDYDPNDAVANLEIHKIISNPTDSPYATVEDFRFLLAKVNDFADNVDWSAATDMGTTSSTGVIKFPITLEQVGIYKYKIKEFIPVQVPDGWTYTEKVEDIIIEVIDSYDHTGLVAKVYPAGTQDTSNATSTLIVTFENVYAPEPAELVIDFVGKLLDGRDMAAGEFTFTVYNDETEEVCTTGTNAAAAAGQQAAVSFEDSLSFDAVGEYHFSVREDEAVKPGITLDEEIYHFTVVVSDNGEGALSAVMTMDDGYNADNTVTFKNTYTTQDVTYSFMGTKEFTGKALTANAFRFFSQPCDENGTLLLGSKPFPVYNDENGEFYFPEVTYTQADTYYYLIWEYVPSGDTMGIVYDESKYLAAVTVTDNTAEAHLEAEAVFKKQTENGWVEIEDGIVFSNSYSTTDTSVAFSGSKTMVGMDLIEGAYSFELYSSDAAWNLGSLLDTQKNGAPSGSNTGTFTFKELSFDSEGVYHFIAKEVLGSEKGISYDGTVYCITVTVSDNGRGQLVTSTDIETSTGAPADSLAFVNEYTVVEGASVTVLGQKTLQTGDGTDVDFSDFTFSFELYETDASFTVSGTPETADSAADGSYSFTLDYTPEDLGNTYHYVILETNYGVGGMTYSTEQYHITVSVTDEVKDGVLETAVTITDKDGNPVGTDEIDFVNNYAINEPAKFTISGTKVLTGRDIKLNEFRFLLYSYDGSTLIASAYCGTDGQFAFSDITVNRAGIHSFILKEDTSTQIPGITYDTTEYRVTVTVDDNKDGTLKVTDINYTYADNGVEVIKLLFTNHYRAEDSVPLSLTANKVLSGRDMTAGEFTFVIYDEDNEAVYTTGTNAAAAAGVAAAITFQKNFVFDKVGTYRFSVYEQATDIPGVTSDGSKFYLTVVVTDNGEGQLEAVLTVDGQTGNTVSFNNSYEADDTSVTLSGLKVLEGQVLTANAFSFHIQPCDQNGNVSGEAKLVHNGENGVITFPEYTYTASGIYHYLVWENIPTGELYGVTYDETRYIATVTVTDDTASGKLTTQVTHQIQLPGESTWTNTDSGIVFGNRYDASGTFVILEGTKTVTGMALAANDYSFELYKADEAWNALELLDTRQNGAADDANTASFSFAKQSYDAEGTFYYIVKEQIPEARKNGVTYDETEYRITVTVTDNGKGLLVPEAVFALSDGTPADAIAFENLYAPVEGTSVTVLGEKTLETGDGTDVNFSDFIFSFELHTTDESFALTEAPQIADSAADGKYSFTMDYVPEDLNKTFHYVIIEKNYGIGGMTYSEAEYRITVEVLDTVKDGVLETVVTITDKDGNAVDSDKIDFINNYAIIEPAKATVSGTKELSGRDIQANEFKFDLYASNELMEVGTEPMCSVFCGTDGKFVFSDIQLDTAGIHYFILTEDSSAAVAKPGVTYDDARYLVAISVSDNKNGKLTVTGIGYEKIGTGGNEAVEAPVFRNKYSPSATFPLHLSGNKVLNGRELTDGEFTFILQAANSQFQVLESEPAVKAVNNETGFFTFDGMVYNYAGTYYYVISEDTSLDIDRVTFDEAKYYVTVKVTDDIASGKLVANYTVKTAPDSETNVEAITFTNVYTPRPDDITVELNVVKTVVNLGTASLSPEGFQFALELLGTDASTTATSDTYGKALFTLSFTEDDIGNTYSFRLSEVNTGMEHVTYSTVEYLIDITITLDESNKLVASIVQNAVETEAVTAEFINEYDYTPVPPDGPETGDFSGIHLWIAILVLSTGAILSLSLMGKKETSAQ